MPETGIGRINLRPNEVLDREALDRRGRSSRSKFHRQYKKNGTETIRIKASTYTVMDQLCLAKTPSGHEIKSLHKFLNPPICYDCSLCSDFSVSGREQSSGFCDRGRTCSWRTSHFVSSSVYSSVETGGPNWPSSISSSGL